MLLAQRANIDRYPPVLHQLRILSPMHEITVVDRIPESEHDELQSPQGVERVRVRYRADTRDRLSVVHRLAEAVAFSREYYRQLARNPAIAVAYDSDVASLMLRSTRAVVPKRIVHLHELINPTTVGRTTKVAIRYVLKNLKRADLVILPDAHRARVIAESAELNKEPVVVMNCPALLPSIPTSRLLPALRERGIATSKIVHYQGGVGPDHNLESIIESMRVWPDDAVFVLVGGGREKYVQKLQAQAAALGKTDSVIFLGRVPYRDVFSYATGAAVGLTFLEPTTENERYSAGASNKRFEYAALGIAQVTNAGPGMDEIFGRPKFASLIEHVDTESIGREIARLLSNPSEAAAMGERARVAHLRTNNYEAQFAPVQGIIESWLSDAS